jgi:acyl-CoA synthetase (AMP-forming)/AMP-acid ligase II
MPDAIAIRVDREVVTYADLLACADELTLRLRAHGIVAGDRVGLHLPNSRNLVVAMTAALLGGMPYVPLAPEHPAERLANIVRNAGVRAVVSDVEHPRYFDVVVVPADRTLAGLQDQRHPVDDRYPVDPHPHEVAYTRNLPADTDHGDAGQADQQRAHARRIRFQAGAPRDSTT